MATPRSVPIRELSSPIVPGTYVELWLSLLEARGVPRERILEGTGIGARELRDAGRVTPVAVTLAIVRGIALTQDLTLAYEFGLTMKPTAHGVLGYALLTCATLRDAILLAQRHLHVRIHRADVRLCVEGELASIVLGNSLMPTPLRPFILEVFTGAILRTGETLLGAPLPPYEVWMDYPEPAHYRAIAQRVPGVRFGMPRLELRFSAALLDQALPLADAMANREALITLEREYRQFSDSERDDDVSTRLRSLLDDAPDTDLALAQAARKLHTSERTLKRHLHAEGTTFKRVAAEVRLARAQALLRDGSLTIERVATMLGYTDAANFTRAFRRWAGESPRAFRNRAGAVRS